MKKLFSMLFIATMLSMVLVACGDEKDEPEPPTSQTIESVHGEANDTYIVWDINLDRDSSSIYIYNVVFTIGESQSPAMNIRIDSPCTVDKSGNIYNYQGTDIIPYMMMGTSFVPVPSMPVTNFVCTVNTKDKTYSTSFDCHGGHWSKSGKLK